MTSDPEEYMSEFPEEKEARIDARAGSLLEEMWRDARHEDWRLGELVAGRDVDPFEDISDICVWAETALAEFEKHIKPRLPEWAGDATFEVLSAAARISQDMKEAFSGRQYILAREQAIGEIEEEDSES